MSPASKAFWLNHLLSCVAAYAIWYCIAYAAWTILATRSNLQ